MAKHPWPNETFRTRAVMHLQATVGGVAHGFPTHLHPLLRALDRVLPGQPFAWSVRSFHGAETYYNDEFEGTCADAIAGGLSKITRDARLAVNASCARGRGALARRPLNLSWTPSHEEPDRYWLMADLELSDVLPEHFPEVRGVIQAFFDGLPEIGTVRKAFGTLRPIRPQWPVENYSTQDFEPPIQAAENAGFYGAVPPGTIETLTWLTLLGPEHLEALGGKDTFLERAKKLAKDQRCKTPLAIPVGALHALVELPLWANPWTYPDSEKTADSLRTTPEPSRWLARELSDARLFSWQNFTPPVPPATTPRTKRATQESATVVAAPTTPSATRPVPEPARTKDALWERLRANPPECLLDEPAAATAAEHKWAQANYGQFATAFVVANDQGNTSLPLWVRFVPESMSVIDPIMVGHHTRQGASFLFQSHRHGYNGKQGHNHWPRRKAPDLFHCPRCGQDKFRVLTVFQYSGDEDDESDPRVKRSPQDFFSWLAIRATCSACKWSGTIADIECA